MAAWKERVAIVNIANAKTVMEHLPIMDHVDIIEYF